MQDATDVGDGRPAASRAPSDLPAGTLLAYYRIEGVLGRGGMGVVYRATDTKLNRAVAIKFLSIDIADARAKERFRQEASTASSLNHPHIVTVHDVGEHDGRQFIVTELVDGGTLDDWSSATRHGWRQRVELVTGIADAVAAAHQAGVLHRDIKPGNILIGSNGYAKLADFGLAKLIGAEGGGRESTQRGVIVGTVAYMSPEQAAGQPLDERSDVFSFGIVLHELLAGERPFDGASDLETLKSIVHASPSPLPGDVPELLRMAVDKALEKDPADRYQTMRDLVADLRRAVRKSSSSQTAVQPAADAHALAAFVARYRPALLGALALAAVGGVYFFATRPPPTTLSTATSASQPYEITRLTTSGNAIAPAIAPDGRYVAYVQSDESAGTTSLWVRQIATPSNVRIVASEPGVWIGLPTVTPDGNFVDFVRAEANAPPDLWRVPFLGGTPRLVARDVDTPVGWSPDGRQMAFIRNALRTSGSSDLVVANADGGAERVVAARRLPLLFPSNRTIGRPMVRPAWSPDGQTIAVFDIENPRVRIVLVDVATGEETIHLAGAGLPHGIAWLGPTQLVVSQGRDFVLRAQLSRMSYPEGVLSLLTNDLDSYVGIDIDAGRRNLVTSRREMTSSLWVSDAAGSNATQIVPPQPYSNPIALPTVSWAGERLIFERLSDGPPTLVAVDPDGTSEELVADAYQAVASRDGRTLVFRRGWNGLWKTDAPRAQPVLVTAEFMADPRLTPDGGSVVFLSTRDGTQSPWLLSMNGGEPTQLAQTAIGLNGRIDISPDGRRLMFVSSDTNEDADPKVSLCDLPACSNRRDIPGPESFRPPFRFTPDGTAIAYLDRTGTNIWALPLDGGPHRQITSFPADAAGGAIANYAWSSDGTRLAFARTRITEDIVLFRGLQP